MPKAAKYTLIWSVERDSYELHELGRGRDCAHADLCVRRCDHVCDRHRLSGACIARPDLAGGWPRQQGVVQGGSQSIQSLAMVVGPLIGGVLYTQIGHGVPFWFGAGVVGLAIIATLLAVLAIRAHRAVGEASAA